MKTAKFESYYNSFGFEYWYIRTVKNKNFVNIPQEVKDPLLIFNLMHTAENILLFLQENTKLRLHWFCKVIIKT